MSILTDSRTLKYETYYFIDASLNIAFYMSTSTSTLRKFFDQKEKGV